MIEAAELKKFIARELKARGLQGRGGKWRLVGEEVQWAVDIERNPRHRNIDLYLGVDLQVDTIVDRADDSGITMDPEFQKFAEGIAAVEALNPRWPRMSDAQRLEELEALVEAMVQFMKGRMNLEAVRAAYRAGEFRSSVIRKEVRAILEQDGALPSA